MKINKIFLKVMSVVICITMAINPSICFAKDCFEFQTNNLYENFMTSISEALKQDTGITENANADELALAVGILEQNPEAVSQILDFLCNSSDTDAFRTAIGLDRDGTPSNINNGLVDIEDANAARALYFIASMVDTNQYLLTQAYVDGSTIERADQYIDAFTATSREGDAYIIHNWQGGYFSNVTYQMIQNAGSGELGAGLEHYFNYGFNDIYMACQGWDVSQYFNFDGDAANNYVTEISTGTGESAQGSTTNEITDNNHENTAENSVITRPDEETNTNIESSTGVDMDEYIDDYKNNLFGFTNSVAGSKPAFTLANLSNRVNALFNKGENKDLGDLTDFVAGDLVSLVAQIGKFIMYGAILFFGVRTIWSGVEGKSQFKELLPFLLVAIVFFEFGEEVFNLIKEIVLGGKAEGAQDYETLTSDIWASVLNIVRILAFGGIMFTGVKLLFAGPTAKAEAKSHLMPLLIGCILVFASSTVVSIILGAAKDAGLVKQTSSLNNNLYVASIEYVDKNKC